VQKRAVGIERLPKIVGADTELGNFLEGVEHQGGTGRLASQLLLRNIDGIPGSSYSGYSANPQDIGRKWLDNGSCCYIDLDHLEMCLPETRSAWDFTAAMHAQLRLVRNAQQRAEYDLARGVALRVLACNSDGLGASWGSHLNFLISRRCYENLFHRRIHYLLWLASYHASSILVAGQGKVGAENGAPWIDYQISQRADFIEEIVGLQTTFRRPIVNSRDETLCGLDSRFARLHHISSDVNLCHTANILKVGILQILLAMIESETVRIRPDEILQDPVQAFSAFSRDPDLCARQETLDGAEVSALDLQRRFFDAAAQFVDAGGCEQTVPRPGEILALWGDTLDRLAARDWEALSRRLDWVLKRRVLSEVLEDTPGLDWRSPEVKQLDLTYGSLDPADGLYWALEAGDCVDLLAPERAIDRFTREPPSDTRAFTRTRLLREFGRAGVVEIDWDRVRVRANTDRSYYSPSLEVRLDDPGGFTRAETGGLFRQGRAASRGWLLSALRAVAAESTQPEYQSGNRRDAGSNNRERTAFTFFRNWG